ncbi:universal stress protein [Methylobacterium nigriterrae]|uniref:universal stress protein n=1 Tax=Methylobacterium nigriterrae TaxID=3127512 RepID=UPI00301324E5
MKTLFVPVAGHEGLETLIATACLGAQRFDSLMEGARILELAEYVDFSGDLPGSRSEQTSWTDLLRSEELAFQEAFTAAMNARAVRRETIPGAGPSYQWRTGTFSDDRTMSQHARLFSATVVGRPESNEASLSMSSFQAVLFESGRPVLIAPPTPPVSLGEAVLVAWNGATETARTVAFAMPFLQQARRVEVLEVEGYRVPGPSAQELAWALKREGIQTQARTLSASKVTSGEIFLSEAKALGCDLLVKGAYTQSRLRQMIFGGATSHILRHAEVPVFMAH